MISLTDTVRSHVTWFTNEQTSPIIVDENINTTHFVYKVNKIVVCDTLHFTIFSGNEDNHFFIDNTGKIYTNAPLDFEQNKNYSLVVRALYKNKTSGDYSIQATPDDTVVNITVADLNEAPYWNAMSVVYIFCHDVSTGEVIGTLIATDPDAVPNIAYTSSSGPADPFYVNATTGEIIKGSADISTSFEYNFTVSVADKNDSTLKSDRNVVVPVTVRWCDVRRAEFHSPLVRNFTITENENDFMYVVLLSFHFIFYL